MHELCMNKWIINLKSDVYSHRFLRYVRLLFLTVVPISVGLRILTCVIVWYPVLYSSSGQDLDVKTDSTVMSVK